MRLNTPETSAQPRPLNEPHPYIGVWVTGDGHIRQSLLPDGRYVEARGSRSSAYTGAYQVYGDYIVYQDDSGFDADGDFRDDVLYHGGLVMYRAPEHDLAQSSKR